MLCCPHCSRLSTSLNHIVMPKSGLTQSRSQSMPVRGLVVDMATTNPRTGMLCRTRSGLTMFNNVGNCKQCGQQNIVQSCSHYYCNDFFCAAVPLAFTWSLPNQLRSSRFDREKLSNPIGYGLNNGQRCDMGFNEGPKWLF